jgi:hypothetical protein
LRTTASPTKLSRKTIFCEFATCALRAAATKHATCGCTTWKCPHIIQVPSASHLAWFASYRLPPTPPLLDPSNKPTASTTTQPQHVSSALQGPSIPDCRPNLDREGPLLARQLPKTTSSTSSPTPLLLFPGPFCPTGRIQTHTPNRRKAKPIVYPRVCVARWRNHVCLLVAEGAV